MQTLNEQNTTNGDAVTGTDAPEFRGQATYSPEDNKLRLYIGRVPRDEYNKLRAEGWVTLHKQREAGGGDFAAVWTPERRDTALEYAGVILDEDMGPAERAADRAERFGGYRDKRTGEAVERADRYDQGPQAHGFQSQARAEKAAERHNRIADRAGDAWGKAEYWTRRTAGVIAHALHVSSPAVRMGRIKTIEAELRRVEKQREENAERFETWRTIAGMTDAEKQNKAAAAFAGMGYGRDGYKHPRTGKAGSLWDFMREDAEDRLTGAEAAALYIASHTDPKTTAWEDTRLADWANHHRLRLAYENQMLEAQGGRAAFVEIQVGGRIGGKLVVKVNKSPATGRVVSVLCKGPYAEGWDYRRTNLPGVKSFSLYQIETERLPVGAYTEPTPESLAELEAYETERKAKRAAVKAKQAPCPLVNPTDADAERLQAVWNKAHNGDREPAKVARMTQAQYSANNGGTYSACETVAFTGGGIIERVSYMRNEPSFPPVAKVRKYGRSVVILTDKPQKPFPAAAWGDPRPALRAEVIRRGQELVDVMRAAGGWLDKMSKEGRALFDDAQRVGLVFCSSLTQFGLSEEGHAAIVKGASITNQQGAWKDKHAAAVERGKKYEVAA